MAKEITRTHAADVDIGGARRYCIEPATTNQQVEQTQIGLVLGDYMLAEVIGEGPFSTVYKGLHPDGSIKVFKMAKPFADPNFVGETGLHYTQALMQQTGYVGEVPIDPASLLRKQADKLLLVNHKSLPKIEMLVASPRRTYYQTEFIEGDTLRTLITKKKATAAMVLNAARAMDEVLHIGLAYHGDLKPENIMVSPNGVRLIDPGLFDPETRVKVTTALYYPQLIPDDLLAMGLLLWEVVVGEHPLDRRCSSDEFAQQEFSDALWRFVRTSEMGSNYRFSALLELKRPTLSRPELNPDLENALLKSLRLCVNDQGLIDIDEGYQCFSALTKALEAALKQCG